MSERSSPSPAGGSRRRAPGRAGRVAAWALLALLGAGLLGDVAAAQTVGITGNDGVSAQPPPAPTLPGSKGKHQKPHRRRHGKQGQRERPEDRVRPEGGGIDLRASCASFEHVQSYAAWGPALSYGRPVTVAYSSTRCSTPDGEALDVSVDGTATIHDGTSVDGAVIETRPFVVTGTWRRPMNETAWPPAWWRCEVSAASFAWEIPGVYSFSVTAKQGVWTLAVTTAGVQPSEFRWAYDACG